MTSNVSAAMSNPVMHTILYHGDIWHISSTFTVSPVLLCAINLLFRWIYFVKCALLLIRLTGDSAGGNLATTVSLKLRDDKFQPAIKMQVLIYPVVQGLDLQLPSYIQYQNSPSLPQKLMAFFIASYLEGTDARRSAFLNNDHVSPAVKKMKLPYIDVSQLPSKYLVGYEKPSVETGNETMWNELKEKLLNPYFSPLVAERLDGLPLTYLFTAEHDVLRDENLLYAYRLKKSGVKVEHVVSDIAIHPSMLWFVALPEIDKLYRDMTKFIVSNL